MAIQDIDYLGVGKVRDSLTAPSDAALFSAVAAATGVKFDAYLSRSQFSYDAQIAAMRSVASILVAVEGINEGDSALSSMAYGSQTGFAAIAAAQTALYDAIKSDPATRNLTVIGPSYGISADFAVAPDTAAVSDDGNTHQYAGTGNPPFGGIATFLAQAALVSGSNPVIATEAGYYTGSSVAGVIVAYQHSGVSDLVQAKYALAMLFDDWKAGIQTTYFYELMDEVADPANTDSEYHFGLFSADGSPKLAATAIHNLTYLLADNGPARTDNFGYQIVGAAGTGNSLLLEKSNGVFDLAIWNDIRLSDAVTATDIVNPAFPITISFGQYVQSVTEYDPLLGTSAVLTWANVNAISLNMPDHPVLLAITPYPAAQLSLQTFVLPETIAPDPSSANLWSSLIANATETGVAVASVGTSGTRGSVSFNATAQTLSYIPPAYTPLDPIDSFTYTLADANGNGVTGTVSLTETAPANTLYDTIANTRIDAPANGWTLVSLLTGQSLYGDSFTGLTLVGATDTSMYAGTNATLTAGDGDETIGAGSNATITLGNGNNTIGLTGSGNTVVTGNGNNLLYKSLGSTNITMGNGNQTITVTGQNNRISLGVGNSTITLGTDGALSGNDVLTVAGGTNIITAGGANDTITVQAGSGNQIVTEGGGATIEVGGGGSNITAQRGSNQITVLSGSNTIATAGDGDTITLGSGSDTLWASGNSDRVTAGSGTASIDILGQYDTIDLTRGADTLMEQGSHNTIVLAAAGGVATQIRGDVIAASDTLDLTTALGATSWNGSQSTLSSYLHVRDVGSSSIISVAGADIAVLTNSANLTYAGLLAHATLPSVKISTISATAAAASVPVSAPDSTVYDTVAGATIDAPGSGWTLVSEGAGQTLSGDAAAGVTFIGSADTSMYGSTNATFTAGDGNHTIEAGNNATVALGNGNNTIGLTGSGNTVVTGNGNNVLWKSAGTTRITMGDGNQNITVGGYTNVITVGTGTSTINLGTDGAPSGNDHVTVAGGTNSIHAVGADEVILVQGGNNNQIISQGGHATITVGGDSNTVIAQKDSNVITALSGSTDIRTNGDGDTISLGSGGTTLWASGNSDRITTGSGFASIDFLGHTDTIDATNGQVILTEQGGGNTIILAAAGGTPIQIYGDVIAAGDMLDLRSALAATNWNGQQGTLSDYLGVITYGSASAIAIDADGKGPGAAAAIAVLQNTAGLTFAGLLAHSTVT